jgi:hypothetical protein
LAVRCGICLAVKEDYRLLPCLHSFCIECLLTQARKATEDAKPFACAKCRRAHDGVTGDRIGSLVPDFERARMRDELVSRSAGAEGGDGAKRATCEYDDDVAVGMCGVCGTMLCGDCAKVHKKRRATSDHTIAPLGEGDDAAAAGAFKRDVKCPTHALPLDYFCQECDTCFCQKCAIIGHAAGHRFVGVAEQVSPGRRAECAPHVVACVHSAALQADRLRACVVTAIEAVSFSPDQERGFKTALATKRRAIEETHAQLVASLEEKYAALRGALEASRSALVARAAAHFEKQKTDLNAQEKCVELHADGIAHCVRFARDTARDGTPVDLAVGHALLVQRLRDAAEDNKRMSYEPACDPPAEATVLTTEALSTLLSQTCNVETGKAAAFRLCS